MVRLQVGFRVKNRSVQWGVVEFQGAGLYMEKAWGFRLQGWGLVQVLGWR